MEKQLEYYEQKHKLKNEFHEQLAYERLRKDTLHFEALQKDRDDMKKELFFITKFFQWLITLLIISDISMLVGMLAAGYDLVGMAGIMQLTGVSVISIVLNVYGFLTNKREIALNSKENDISSMVRANTRAIDKLDDLSIKEQNSLNDLVIRVATKKHGLNDSSHGKNKKKQQQ